MRRGDAPREHVTSNQDQKNAVRVGLRGLLLRAGVVVDVTSPGDDGPGGSGSSMTRKVKSHLNGN